VTALWGLLVTGALVGVAYHGPGELRRAYHVQHRHWRDAPLTFAEQAFVAMFTGVGAGMSGGAAIMVGAALLARLA
jgi:hypothetical protein